MVDTLNSLVQLFSEQDEYLSQFGGKGNLDHQLDYPHGLSVDNIGNIIVADRYNKSILKRSFLLMVITYVNSGMRVLLPSPLTTYNMTNVWLCQMQMNII